MKNSKIKYFIVTVLLSVFYFTNRNLHSGDSYVYKYISKLYSFNKVPYLDSFDHKGLSLYLIQSVGVNFEYLNVFIEFFLVLTSLLLLLKVLTVKFGKYIANFTIFYIYLSYILLFESLHYTENYVFAFQIICFTFLIKSKRSIYNNLLIGVLFLVSFTIRANLIGFWIALFFFESYKILFTKKSKESLINLFQYFLGILIYGLFLAFYFLKTNSFNDFIDCSFIFNFSYSNGDFISLLRNIIKSIRFYNFSIFLFLGILFSFLLIFKKRKKGFSIFITIWCLSELVLSNLSPLAFAHYYIMWIPASAGSFIVISYFINYSKIKLISSYKSSAIIFFFFMITWFLSPSYVKIISLINKTSKKEIKKDEAIDFILTHHPNESLVVLGNQNDIYLKTNKVAANYFSYQTPIFYYNAPIVIKMIDRFSSEIINSKPQLIIDTRNPFITVDYNNMIDEDYLENERFIGSIVNKKGVLDNHKLLKKFREFVNLNYQIIKRTNSYDIYILKKK